MSIITSLASKNVYVYVCRNIEKSVKPKSHHKLFIQLTETETKFTIADVPPSTKKWQSQNTQANLKLNFR